VLSSPSSKSFPSSFSVFFFSTLLFFTVSNIADVDVTYVTTNCESITGPKGDNFTKFFPFDFEFEFVKTEDCALSGVSKFSGRGMDSIPEGSGIDCKGIDFILVTLAPHLMSTEYCFAAFSRISVIDDDLL
jgi:hypothetical protein